MPQARTEIDRKNDGVHGVDASHTSDGPRLLTIRRGDRGKLIYLAGVVPHHVYRWRMDPVLTLHGPVTARLHRCQNGLVELL